MNAWEGLDPTGVISQLLSAAQEIEAQLDAIASKRVELTLAQLQVLRLLEAHPGAQPSQLSQALGCTRGNITGIVNRLQKNGLVERHHSQQDRRVVHLHLTKNGRKLARTEAGVQDACRRLVDNLGEEQSQHLRQLLALLVAGADDALTARFELAAALTDTDSDSERPSEKPKDAAPKKVLVAPRGKQSRVRVVKNKSGR